MIWDVARRMGRQVRIVAGMGGAAVVGFDLPAGLALSAAIAPDVPAWVVAEALSDIEPVAVKAMNEQAEGGNG